MVKKEQSSNQASQPGKASASSAQLIKKEQLLSQKDQASSQVGTRAALQTKNGGRETETPAKIDLTQSSQNAAKKSELIQSAPIEAQRKSKRQAEASLKKSQAMAAAAAQEAQLKEKNR